MFEKNVRAGQNQAGKTKSAAMAITNTTCLRVTGKLAKGERHYLLQCEDETVWRLKLLEVDVPEDTENVIVYGLKSVIDSIDVDWIGSQPQTDMT